MRKETFVRIVRSGEGSEEWRKKLPTLVEILILDCTNMV